VNSLLRILHLEDDPRDAELVEATLKAEGVVCQVTRVETEPEFCAALEQDGFHLICADYTLPSFDGISALKIAAEKRPDAPFIFLSGTLDEEVAIETLKMGATDYVFKTRLSRLVPAVQRALRESVVRADRKRAREALRRSEAYLAEAQKLSHTGSFGWDVSRGNIYWSQETFRIFEYEPAPRVRIEQVLERTHPEDRVAVQQLINRVSQERSDFDLEHRLLMPNGAVKFVHVVGRPSTDERGSFELVGAVTDITERKRAEALLAGEKRLLEMIATGVPLKEILNNLCLTIEEQRPDTLASVLLLNPDGIHLDVIAAPTLPKEWTRQMEKLPIGPCAGSCGTAAYRGSPVIVSDIGGDPLWDIPQHRASALNHGLRASWSNPVLTSEGKVLGTFCMYSREARTPALQDIELIELATHLVRVAIEREQAEEALRRSERFLAEGQRISHTGSWGWNLHTGKIIWSDEQCRMLGFDVPTEPSFELFFSRVHPEDRARVRQVLDQATRAGSEYEIQYRVVLPNEIIRYFKSVGRPVRKQNVDISEYIGITIDVTESKRAENALRASEQVARGQVEALVQSLDVLTTAPPPEEFITEMLSTIRRLLDAQNVILWSFKNATDELVLRAGARDTSLAAIRREHPFVRDGLSWKQSTRVREMLVTGRPVACEDIENDLLLSPGLREYFRGTGTKRFLTIPTLINGRVKGFIGIRHGDRAPYRPEEVELAQALAHQAMFAIQLNELAEKGRQAAVLEERNRVARDIHDTIAQGLMGVIVQLQAAGDATSKGYKKQARDHLQNANTLARDSLNEARRSVSALRPQALEKATFWEALQRLVKNATAGTELRTEFRIRGKACDLSLKAEENLLHIGQEALTNALKYAHATRFGVRLSFKANEIRLELEDNGDGFNVHERQDGFGLKGMRERADQMGAKFSLTSRRNKGTKIIVTSPYTLTESSVLST
jgi:PAS domain S-box-containing protein